MCAKHCHGLGRQTQSRMLSVDWLTYPTVCESSSTQTAPWKDSISKFFRPNSQARQISDLRQYSTVVLEYSTNVQAVSLGRTVKGTVLAELTPTMYRFEESVRRYSTVV